MKKLAWWLACFSALLGSLHFVRLRAPSGLRLWLPKLMAGALSPFLALTGAFGAVLGFLSKKPFTFLLGVYGLVASGRYVRRVTAFHDGFERAFGPGWEERIPIERRLQMLHRRWTWIAPSPPPARWERDVPFWSLSDSGRQLLCDLWRPPADARPSGLALIYLHGSAWCLGDKDLGTRTFFRHLAGQGHVVMDVAYRMYPEVGLRGMLDDVRRAIVWMKTNAAQYRARPDRIVLMGGSAGGHLALLAAYTSLQSVFPTEDLQDADTSVRAVVAFYGPGELRRSSRQAEVGIKASSRPGFFERRRQLPKSVETAFGIVLGERAVRLLADTLAKLPDIGHLDRIVGGAPSDLDEMIRLASPITHVSPACPPTLLLHGEHDLLVPIESSRALYRKLRGAGVPAVLVEFPQTDHAFDLVAPRISPTAQAALYDVERFLALME